MKQQSTQTAQGAKHAGQRVAHTAMEQGRQVVQETRDKARGMADQAQTQLQQQVGEQQKRAAGSLHDLGDQLRSMADKTEQPGLAPDLVQQASGRVQQMVDWLERREPGQALDDVRNFARRHPGLPRRRGDCRRGGRPVDPQPCRRWATGWRHGRTARWRHG